VLHLPPELVGEFDPRTADRQTGRLQRLGRPGVAGVQRRVVPNGFIVAAVGAAGVRVGLDRKQGPVALRQRTRDEGLQRGHLLRCDGQPGDAVGAEDILELLRADTRHQHQPVAVGVVAQRLRLGRSVAVVIGKAARRSHHDAESRQRRKELPGVADAGEGQHAAAAQRGCED